jgi:hypothetical protein
MKTVPPAAHNCILLAVALLAATACAATAAQPLRTDGGPPPAADVPKLIERLGHGDWQVRDEAMRALVALGSPAREALRHAGQSPDPEVRWRAKYALSQLQDSLAPAAPDLARALYQSAALARRRPDGLDAARRLYREVVERFPKTPWAAAARERLAALDPRAAAPAALPKDLLSRLVAQLASPDWRVRQEASVRLAQFGDAAREPLQHAAQSPDHELAWRAQRLLDRLAPAPAAEAKPEAPAEPRIRLEFAGPDEEAPGATADTHRLVDALGSQDPDRVAAARELLRNIGDEAVQPLLRGFDRCDEVAAVEIAALLQEITGEKLGFDPERWKTWWMTESRRGKE